jgi:hypothetical protein
VNPYGTEGTPELDDLQQEDMPEGMLKVPVKVIEIPTLEVHKLPARRAVMRSVTATEDVVQQLVGYDLRRSRLTIWGDAIANGVIILGTRKDEVEQETAARWPVQINTGVNGIAPALTMEHCEAVWVKAKGENAVVSYIAEYWAD